MVGRRGGGRHGDNGGEKRREFLHDEPVMMAVKAGQKNLISGRIQSTKDNV